MTAAANPVAWAWASYSIAYASCVLQGLLETPLVIFYF